MPNSFFRFRRFVIHQEKCAMKVGTDSVLLGAWAHGGARVLDIGAGTGVIALMMAQRFPQALVDAVEIDQEACCQAEGNVVDSPFARQVSVICSPVQLFASRAENAGCYDAIVSNPPFFENALKAPTEARAKARHNDALPFDQLFKSVVALMKKEGEFSAIIPFDYKSRFEEEAALAGLVISRVCAVKTTPTKQPKRYLMAFTFPTGKDCEFGEGLLETTPGVRSEWYRALTSDFYL